MVGGWASVSHGIALSLPPAGPLPAGAQKLVDQAIIVRIKQEGFAPTAAPATGTAVRVRVEADSDISRYRGKLRDAIVLAGAHRGGFAGSLAHRGSSSSST